MDAGIIHCLETRKYYNGFNCPVILKEHPTINKEKCYELFSIFFFFKNSLGNRAIEERVSWTELGSGDMKAKNAKSFLLQDFVNNLLQFS